tara:strand:- start:4685 stop:4930 length:246 start_codon:yes stop_codon:yes gene_type:complete
MPTIKKLTPEILKKFIVEEKKKIHTHADKTVEDAWSGGNDNLVKKIDYIKKLGIQEAKLKQALNKVQKHRLKLKETILKEL